MQRVGNNSVSNNRPPNTSALRLTAAILSAALLLPLAGLVGCERAQSQDIAAKPKPPEVFFALPEVHQVTDHEDFTGFTQAIRTVQIRARVSGYLDKVNFVEGAMVHEGDVLCEVDPRPYQAAYDSAVGQVHLTEAALKQAKADNARAKGLAGTPGAISQQDRDKYEATEEQGMAQIETSKANMATAKLNLAFTKVVAPFSGRISARMVDPGNLVIADTTPLTTIVTEDPIYAYFFVDEHTLLRVRRLNERNKVKSMQDTRPEVQLGLTDETDFPHKGKIDFEDNQVDQQTGTLRLRGIFPNADRLLSPGLFVRIRLPIGEPHDALVVPEEALGTDQGQKFLYVIDDHDVAQYRKVEVGQAYGEGMQVIAEGLNPGERVVVNGLQRVRAGNPVTPKPAPAKAEAAHSTSLTGGAAPPAEPHTPMPAQAAPTARTIGGSKSEPVKAASSNPEPAKPRK
ncbi:MAG TPA: efflux RND transporter periplasmic adaptor subunit [Pirellulales bacterium]|jgi:multidrug efflux system membrane fusion protein|nr:efflux RND transporter periplasmic adaptor subunit [Pirellulales bacterium]